MLAVDLYKDILYRRFREAGFEDGIDFKVDGEPKNCSTRFLIWFDQNCEVLKSEIQKEMLLRYGLKPRQGPLLSNAIQLRAD